MAMDATERHEAHTSPMQIAHNPLFTAREKIDLLNQLKGIRIVSCTTASWRFPSAAWGLSFAGWNAAISLALGVVALFGAAWSGARSRAPLSAGAKA